MLKFIIISAVLVGADDAPELDPDPPKNQCVCVKWVQSDGGYIYKKEIQCPTKKTKR